MNNLLKLSLLASLSISPLGVAAEQQDVVKLTILHTNDHHGRFWHDSRGQLGMAARQSLIENVRNEVESAGGRLLVLSAGDVNTGVPESDLQYAKPDFIGMRALQYDVMAVGNHEFDVPFGVLRMQQVWSQVPFLSANIYYKDTDSRPFSPYKIFDLDGLSVGVVGLTTIDTPVIGSRTLREKFDFKNPVQESLKAVKAMGKTDVTIGLTHMGHYLDSNHGSSAPGDVTLARELPTGTYDLIVGGHSQNPVCFDYNDNYIFTYVPGDNCKPDYQNGTWIMQAQEWGRYVGRIDLSINKGDITLDNYELIPVNLKYKTDDGYAFHQDEVPQDKAIYDLLEPYYQSGNELINYAVGHTEEELVGERSIVRSSRTNLGSIISDSMMLKTSADMALVSSGGVRDTIEAGDISYRDILKVLPFGNTINKVRLTGTELEQYLDVVRAKTPGTGAFAQYSSNFELTDSGYLLNGMPLDSEATYGLAVTGYNARGGDGYPELTGHSTYVDTGFVDADVLKDYFVSKGQ